MSVECISCGTKQRRFQYRTNANEPICADCFMMAVETLMLPNWVINKLKLRQPPIRQ